MKKLFCLWMLTITPLKQLAEGRAQDSSLERERESDREHALGSTDGGKHNIRERVSQLRLSVRLAVRVCGGRPTGQLSRPEPTDRVKQAYWRLRRERRIH